MNEKVEKKENEMNENVKKEKTEMNEEVKEKEKENERKVIIMTKVKVKRKENMGDSDNKKMNRLQRRKSNTRRGWVANRPKRRKREEA